MASTVETDLREWLKTAVRIVIVGVGNSIREDDNIGLTILQGLKGKLSSDVLLLECEMTPEGYMLDIEDFKPSHVLLVDSAVLGREVGDADLVKVTEVAAFSAVSSHMLPLRLFCEYIEKSTGAKIRLLLVEPKSMGYGERLTPELQMASACLVEALLRVLNPRFSA
jgi:hydrogenase 3 maturation protease